MHVVFDSSALRLGRALSGINAQYLAAYSEHETTQFHVPEVVVLETETLIREHVAAEYKKVVKSLDEFRRLGVALPFGDMDQDKLAEAAVTELHRTLNGLQIGRLSLPETGGHQKVLERLQTGRRPFRGTPGQRDVGYRDYLVWETILGLAHSGDSKVAFVTANIKDFAEEDPVGWRLHSELVAESRDKGLDVDLYTSIERFLSDVVKPSLPAAARVGALLSMPQQEQRLRQWIADHMGEEGYGHVIEDVMEWKGGRIEDVTVVGGYEVDDLSIEDVSELDSATVVADVRAQMDLLVDYYVFKADAFLLEYEDFRGLSDWNEHYYWGETDMYASVELEVTLSVAEDKVEPQSLSISAVTIHEP